MKAFIDRLYCFYNFTDERPGPWSSQLADLGRKAVVIAVGEQTNPEEGGMDLALKAMCLPVEALGYEIIDEMPVLGIFHKGIVKQHPEKLEKAENIGRLLASSLSHIFK